MRTDVTIGLIVKITIATKSKKFKRLKSDREKMQLLRCLKYKYGQFCEDDNLLFSVQSVKALVADREVNSKADDRSCQV